MFPQITKITHVYWQRKVIQNEEYFENEMSSELNER